jgi:protein-histidine pros-kinase
MSLLYKFVSIVLLILLIGLVATGTVAYYQLKRLADNQVEQQAKLMMRAALATRDYTTKHIKKLVEKLPQTNEFVKERVPAFAATTTLNSIHEDSDFEKYTYREPSQKWTSQKNEADEFEKELLRYFREDPKKREKWEGEVHPKVGESAWVYARPLIAHKECLECHNTPAEAPPNMLAKYGNHGFGWEEDKVEAAQIVYVPMSEPERIRNHYLWPIIGTMVLFTALTLLALGVALRRIVIRPVARLSEMADELSRGNLSQGELPVHGNDEIATLTGSFNRMSVSLSKAMKMVKDQ